MEALGGDQEWRVRFLAQHSAIVYFLMLIIMWLTSPSLAYNFSELIEAHAVVSVDTDGIDIYM
jgi:ubiquinol oxidase